MVVEEISALNGVARKVSVDPSDGSIVDTDRNRLREASAQDPVPFVKKSPCTAVGNDVTFSDDPLRGAALSSEADEVKRRTRVIDPQTEAEAPPSCAPPAAVDQKWKPVVLDRSQLLDSYLKLSKIRLTGMCSPRQLLFRKITAEKTWKEFQVLTNCQYVLFPRLASQGLTVCFLQLNQH